MFLNNVHGGANVRSLEIVSGFLRFDPVCFLLVIKIAE